MSGQKQADLGRKASLARSSAIMFAGTLVSRLLGFVRNALVVVALGATASGAADAFNTANALPTQLYNLLLGGILNAVLVPQIVRALRQDNGDDVVNRLLTAAGALVAGVAAVMTIASPLVVLLYASGLGRWQPLAVAFTFWCMPQVFFYGLTALWGQVLNAKEHFGPYMWAPVVNNVIAILSLLAYVRLYGAYAAGGEPQAWDGMRIAVIAGGATLGIVLQALTLYLPLRRTGFRPKLVWGVRGIGLRETSIVASWALAGVLVTGLADIAWTNLGSAAVTEAERAAASGLIIPSTTMWNNAQLIYVLPQSLVTTSIITALFTRMSVKAAERDGAGVRDDFSLGARSVAVFTMLATVGIGVLATPALQAFVPTLSLAEAQASAPMLVALALGIVPQGLWFTAQRVLLAYTDTRRLFWAYVPVGTVPIVAAFLIHAVAPAQHWMTLAALVNTLCHVIGLAICVPFMRRYLPDLDSARIARTHLRLGVAAVAAALVGTGIRSLIGPADGSLTGRRPVDALVTILVVAVVMTVVYLLVAAWAKVEELSVATGPAARILRKVGRLLGPAGGPVLALAERLAPVAATATAPASVPAPAAAPVPVAEGGTGGTVPAGRAATASVPGAGTGAAAAPGAPRTTETVLQPSATMGLDSRGKREDRGVDEGKPIGSGRYRVLDTLPTTLPHIIRHRGKDTILDRDVTILMLTPATAHREEVLSAAARAVLVEDQRCQRIYDVDQGREAFIVSEPISGVTLPRLVEQGLPASQARAIIGEAAQALASASLRNLHHLVLQPESVRVDAHGQVKVTGVGIDGAARGMDSRFRSPLLADKDDARALVELLYYAVTGRWPGKRSGVRPAPRRGGMPVPPSEIASGVAPEIDALCERVWKDDVPRSAAEVAALLEPWPQVQAPKVPPRPRPAQGPASPPAATGSPARAVPGSRQPGPQHQEPAASPLSGAGALVSASAAAVGAGAAAAASTMAGATRSFLTRFNRSRRTETLPAPGAPRDPAHRTSYTPDRATSAPADAGPVAADPVAAGTAAADTMAAPQPGGTTLPPAQPAPLPGAPAAGVGRPQQVPPTAPSWSASPQAAPAQPYESPATPVQAYAVEAATPTVTMPSPQEGAPGGPGSTRIVDIDSVQAEVRTPVVVSSELTNVGPEDPALLEEDTSFEELVSGEDEGTKRSTNGVLIAIGVAVLLIVALAIANLLDLARVPLTDQEIPAAQTVPSQNAAAGDGSNPEPPAAPVVAGAQVLDGEEHPELASAITDGDPVTDWYTRFYNDPKISNNGKAGIGVAFKLQAPATVSSVELQGTSAGGHFQLRSTTAEDPAGGTVLAEGAFAEGTTQVSVSPTQVESMVLWVTEMPRTSNGENRVTLAEVTVR